MASSILFQIFSITIVGLAWSSQEVVAGLPAIFVFGDSLGDVGNNNNLNIANGNIPPYGIDFPGGTPTGRFSNGYNHIDWLAKFVGYKQSPPSYLSLRNGEQILQGVNFASGGSGILDTTGQTINFTTQIVNFKSIVRDLETQMDKKRAYRHLSKSLFIITTGSTDLFIYYLTFGSRNITRNQQFIDVLVDKFSDHLKTLYEYGARKFGIIGIPQIGCNPVMRYLNPTGECVNDLNSLVRKFNTATKARIHDLEFLLGGMKYSYGNVYDLMSLALEKPHLFGYKEIKSACCGSGKFNGATSCTSNATLCSNRSQYLYWDQFHPTQATSKIAAMKLYGGSSPRFTTPINLKALIKH